MFCFPVMESSFCFANEEFITVPTTSFVDDLGPLRSAQAIFVWKIVDWWQSVFLPRYFSSDYEERLFSQKENGTRHGRGTHEYHPVSISLHGQRHLRSR